MKKIKITQGKTVRVDDDDFPVLSRFSWSYYLNKISGKSGVCTVIGTHNIYMQQLVMPNKPGFYARHINDDVLDNRKENLEMITLNHRRHLGVKKQIGASQYRGVQLRCRFNTKGTDKKGRGYWVAVIAKDHKRYFIGVFKKEEEKMAAEAYNKKARELYGKFAYQNKL